MFAPRKLSLSKRISRSRTTTTTTAPVTTVSTACRQLYTDRLLTNPAETSTTNVAARTRPYTAVPPQPPPGTPPPPYQPPPLQYSTATTPPQVPLTYALQRNFSPHGTPYQAVPVDTSTPVVPRRSYNFKRTPPHTTAQPSNQTTPPRLLPAYLTTIPESPKHSQSSGLHAPSYSSQPDPLDLTTANNLNSMDISASAVTQLPSYRHRFLQFHFSQYTSPDALGIHIWSHSDCIIAAKRCLDKCPVLEIPPELH